MAEDSPFQSDTSEELKLDKTIPYWQRFLFATVLPNVVLYGGLLLYFLLKASQHTEHHHTPEDGFRGMAIVFLFPVVCFFVIFLGVIPITICTICAARIRWKHWVSAMAGGFAAILCGLLLGASILGLLGFLSG